MANESWWENVIAKPFQKTLVSIVEPAAAEIVVERDTMMIERDAALAALDHTLAALEQVKAEQT